MKQKLEAHQALIEKEMEKKLEIEKAMMTQQICSMVMSHLGHLNPSLNGNLVMLSSCFPITQSPRDASRVLNQQLGQLMNVNSSADMHDSQLQVSLLSLILIALLIIILMIIRM